MSALAQIEAVEPYVPPEDDAKGEISADWFDRPQAQSEFANCLLPLVKALGWRGEERQLAEALPHFIDDLEVQGFRNALANLNYTSHVVRIRQDRVDPSLMPCLFIPDKGPVRILLERGEEQSLIFDGWANRERFTRLFPLNGLAVFPQPAEDPLADETTGDNGLVRDLVDRFRQSIRQLLAMTLGVNLLALSVPLFIMSVYDTVIPARSTQQLYYLLAGVGIAMAFEVMFRVLRAKTVSHLAARCGNIIGNTALHRILLLPVSKTENAPVGSQLARLKEFESTRELFSSPIGEALLDIPFAFLFLGIIALLGGPIVFVPITAAFLFLCAAATIAPRLARVTDRSVRARSALERFLVEAVSHVRAIKYTGAGSRWIERYRDSSAAVALAEFNAAKLSHLVFTISQTLVLGAGIATLGVGSMRVMNDEMSIGALVAVMVLGWRVLSPLQAAFVALNQIEQIRAAFRQIAALLRMPAEETNGAALRRSLEGAVQFSWVSHRYSAEADPVLFGVSFEIEKGEIVAITGPNGSGKSTIVKLLTGLYRPQAGSIMIDGVDIRQIDPVRLRQALGVVSQPTHLFYGTIAQNLRFSNPTASRAEMIEAAKTARVYEEIRQLPEEFETRLTEEMLGMLPAGFKQKLALARVYLRNAPILIFDEATQGLDEEGDRAFISTIQKMRGNTTVIIVTHRPSHMKIADKLVLLRNGKVSAVGPPDKLMGGNGGAKP